jgi:hypothetical protein
MTSELPTVGSERSGDFQSLEKIAADPLIRMMLFQEEAFWKVEDLRRFILLWRRQSGKTTLFAYLALMLMLQAPGVLVTYGSVSLKTGTELILRVAAVWRDVVNKFRTMLAGQKLVETNFDNISDEEFDEMFQAGRCEVKVWHNENEFSRTILIAANVNTARGFSGTVLLDEIQSIHELKIFLAEVREIASRNPAFRILMAMTIPPDDAHYSCELIAPPNGADFSTPNPRGHWYRSKAGMMVHRVDIDDAYAAGLTPYDEETGDPITPAQARERSIDKDGFDRNQKLLVIPSGACAIPAQAIEVAQEKGRGTCIACEKELPPNWRDHLGQGRLVIGIDPATTEKETSNPTSFSLMEQVGSMEFAVRVRLRFKTSDPNVTRARLRELLDVGHNRRVSAIVYLATGDRFWATDLRKEFQRYCHIELIIESENVPNFEPAMNFGTYMGRRLVNAFNDRQIWEPDVQWVFDDLRLVISDKGGYLKKMDGMGNHADGFDSDKAALHGQLMKIGGAVEARAVGTGRIGSFLSRFAGGSARDRSNARVIV